MPCIRTIEKRVPFYIEMVLFFCLLAETLYAADTIPPTGSIKINNNVAYTNSIDVILNLSAKDSASGVVEMQFSNDNSTWSTPEAYSTTKSWILSTGLGTKRVYVKYKDNAGNWSAVYSDAIIFDNIAPTGSIKINNGAVATNNTSVTLKLSATDSPAGLSQMRFSNDNSEWSAPENYKTTKIWEVATGDGAKTAYVKFSDKAGNWSDSYSAGIILDTVLPIISNVTTPVITSKNAKVSWSSDEPATSQVEYGFTDAYGSKTGLSTALVTTRTITLSGLTEYSLYHFRVSSKDAAGNQATSLDYTFTTLDSTAPTGSITINNGDLDTNSINVTLNLIATDTGSGVAEMKFSNNGSTWSTPEPYAISKAWALSSGSGTKKVYVKFKDNSDNWSTAYSDTINLANQTPEAKSINPSSGVSGPENAVVFTAVYSDSNGYQDIKQAQILVNASINGANCFFGYYNQGSNKLYLRNDANTAWLGGFAPGSSNTIENSYAKLDCFNTTISGNNLTLTINWLVTFKAAFNGAKNTYLYVIDKSGAFNDWAQFGSWNTQSDVTPPAGSISINNNANYANSTSITLILSAEDNPGGSGVSQMQLSNDSINWAAPEAYATSRSWDLASGDGIKTVYIKFKDAAGNWSQVYPDTITLDTVAPELNITSPLDNEVLGPK